MEGALLSRYIMDMGIISDSGQIEREQERKELRVMAQ